MAPPELGLDVWGIVLRHAGDHAWFARLAARLFRSASVARRPSDDWLAGGVERLALADPYVPREAMLLAARAGRVDVIEWLNERVRPSDAELRDLCGFAAGAGHLPVLEWARRHDFPWGTASRAAADHGHLHILEWAHARGCPWAADTAAVAASRGHLVVLQWVVARGCPSTDVWWAAMYSCHLPTLEWLATTDVAYEYRVWILKDLARRGRADVLEWLAERYPVDMDAVLQGAAEGGHLAITKWAWARGGVDHGAATAAAANGHLDVLEWLVWSAGA